MTFISLPVDIRNLILDNFTVNELIGVLEKAQSKKAVDEIDRYEAYKGERMAQTLRNAGFELTMKTNSLVISGEIRHQISMKWCNLKEHRRLMDIFESFGMVEQGWSCMAYKDKDGSYYQVWFSR